MNQDLLLVNIMFDHKLDDHVIGRTAKYDTYIDGRLDRIRYR